ncbi:hypothetical protein EGI22_19860 [Lacihabitans sp. LS3-19]|uniref:hypothetical protein n=1 Tax=Lacihabitans sp. LS3-19 TaxID=2487335 RepID=UPI0020CBD3E2|nr:hypothetical protein [Lacihabitans sp. LS3-19]MCP9769231.1 hypothetical protein [Lacihabitans sp. LS3-19]MCP9769320.1 hypothetical protein [Lacihabitans sp. LS3-19]MCP9770167.1 hypothetical protein [Lacihabitans sp. LS3-19]
MTSSRRKFVKKTIAFTLGINAIFHSKLFALEGSPSKNVFTKGNQNKLKVWGLLKDENLKPLRNVEIVFKHSNSSNNENAFEYFGKILTDGLGRYSFITDKPLGYFEDGRKKMNRMFFEIKTPIGKGLKTKLFFDSLGMTYVDNHHVQNTDFKSGPVLPKTSLENENFANVEFNINIIL